MKISNIIVKYEDVQKYFDFLGLPKHIGADINEINTAWISKLNNENNEESSNVIEQIDSDEDKMQQVINLAENFQHHQVRFQMFVAINNLKQTPNITDEKSKADKLKIYKAIFDLTNDSNTSPIDSSKLENGEYTQHLQQLFTALQQVNNSNPDDYQKQIKKALSKFTKNTVMDPVDKQTNRSLNQGLVGAIIGAILGFIIGAATGAVVGAAIGTLAGLHAGAIGGLGFGLFNQDKNIRYFEKKNKEASKVENNIQSLAGIPDPINSSVETSSLSL